MFLNIKRVFVFRKASLPKKNREHHLASVRGALVQMPTCCVGPLMPRTCVHLEATMGRFGVAGNHTFPL